MALKLLSLQILAIIALVILFPSTDAKLLEKAGGMLNDKMSQVKALLKKPKFIQKIASALLEQEEEESDSDSAFGSLKKLNPIGHLKKMSPFGALKGRAMTLDDQDDGDGDGDSSSSSDSDSNDYPDPKETELQPRTIPLDLNGCGQGCGLGFKDYEKCGTYHQCFNDKGRMVRRTFTCSGDQSYDEESQKCVDTPSCLNATEPPRNQENYRCDRNYDQHVHPTNCSSYYICHWTGEYYTIEHITCNKVDNLGRPVILYFNEQYKNCEDGSICPQDVTSVGAKKCKKAGQRFPFPDSCTMYHVCRGRRKQFVFETKECDTGKYFDTEKAKCQSGKCPDKDKESKVPPGWACDLDGALYVHPADCHKYYKCRACVFSNVTGEWCYDKFETCPGGEWFDDVKKQCVNAQKCPQDMMQLPNGTGWHCEGPHTANVHPEDCQSYYNCIPCNKPGGWCYEAFKCPGGKWFDDTKKVCCVSPICPQNWTQIPPGFECGFQDEKNVVPGKCTDYYSCFACDRPQPWCYTQHTCPEGQTFDDEAMQCVFGRCPQWPPMLPPTWNCTAKNELNTDPQDCHKYYKCVPCPEGDDSPWCYIPMECPTNQFFDNSKKQCVSTEICPSDEIELPDKEGYHCDMNGEINVNPDDCTQYYKCKKCSRERGWCIEPLKCAKGKFFDDLEKKCVKSKICPQKWKEIPPDWKCESEEEKNVVPGNCTDYFMCFMCARPSIWCYTLHTCPAGQTFSDDLMMCVPGRCPQFPDPLPPGWNCSTADELRVDPTNCHKYYRCIPCPDDLPWCYESEECQNGQFFDDHSKECVTKEICPQELPEVPEKEGWKCEREGEINVDPEDCTSYYTCIRCSRPSGWCYTSQKCPDGKWFDNSKKVCCTAPLCPQNWTQVPPGWECGMNNEKNVVPGNCTDYYVCFACDRPAKWCYEQFTCPEGQTFDDELMRCVPGRCPQWPKPVPPSYNCSNANDLRADPTDCHKYYQCIKCPDDDPDFPWCYWGVQECPKDEWFDESKKECVAARECPGDDTEKPPEWPCAKDGAVHVHPEDCGQYYTCFKCNKPSGFCYEPVMCGAGQYFDDLLKKCVFTHICPQNWTMIPPEWECEFDGEKNGVPGNCTDYYQCFPCERPRMWCYTLHNCPEGHTFDENQMKCIRARCPYWPPVVPEGWNCSKENELNPLPSDCTKYYICVKCPEGDDNPWCYETGSCPDGLWFDSIQKKCIVHRKCPGEDMEVPKEPGWECETDGAIHVLPEECQKYYECYRCSKPSGWCYESTSCPAGHTFDDVLKMCVSGMCPQNKTELPPEWKCGMEHELNVWPENCTKYYECQTCSKPSMWCILEHSCLEGQTFDDTMKHCVYGRCPQDPPVIPPELVCEKDGDVHVHPFDCSRYYKCINTGTYFTWMDLECPMEQKFDDILKQCVDGPICPQDLIEIGEPPDWNCNTEGELNVLPTDCSKYFQCIRCSKPKKWCYYMPESCPGGYNFDQIKKICAEGVCPQERPPLPPEWTCEHEDDQNVIPTDCAKYYVCHRCNKEKGWCYDEFTCPPEFTYDNNQKRCVIGRCPQLPPKVPEDWNCTANGTLHVTPYDCTMYYKCISCDDGPWCHLGIKTCPGGQTFSSELMKCVDGRCPQFPPPIPPKWKCEVEGAHHVHPGNCSIFYTCVACPDMDAWCFRLSGCEEGETFDNVNKRCVSGRCPQLPPQLPPGWNCSYDGELHVHPVDCSKFYTCAKISEEWVYYLDSCPAGYTFDDASKLCVKGRCPQDPPTLPPGWSCEKDEDKHQHPDDCSQFYKCVWVKDKEPPYWSYELERCPSGENFNEETGQCVAGQCPQNRVPLPPGWKCNSDGELNVHPENCTFYYKCIKFRDGWTFELMMCRTGQTFDDTKKACVPGRCPQLPPPLPPMWKCKEKGALNVHPFDCSMYFLCVICEGGSQIHGRGYMFPVKGRSGYSAGARSIGGEIGICIGGVGLGIGIGIGSRSGDVDGRSGVCGWCYQDIKKCKAGHLFDNDLQKCVETRVCPNKPDPVVPPTTVPPGVECHKDGMLIGNPDMCKWYYQCVWYLGGWAVYLHKCPSGQHWMEAVKACVHGPCSGLPSSPESSSDSEEWDSDEDIWDTEEEELNLRSRAGLRNSKPNLNYSFKKNQGLG